jgi:hypothetical protein
MTYTFKKSWRRYKDRGKITRQIRVSLCKQGLVKRSMNKILFYPTPISSSIHVPSI